MRQSEVSEPPDIVNTSIRIPRELLAEAKKQATLEGCSFLDLLFKALRIYLAKTAKSDRKTA